VYGIDGVERGDRQPATRAGGDEGCRKDVDLHPE
jgi:hypothetical protein